ncbi:MAG: hypothetical protein V1850_04530 [Candidatus Bathyarchaeota archaeon]
MVLTNAQMEVVRETFKNEPKSFCRCKHNGDGPNSKHQGPMGTGACTVKGCDCERFSWARFRPVVEKMMKDSCPSLL